MPTYVFHSINWPSLTIEGIPGQFRGGMYITTDEEVAAKLKRQTKEVLLIEVEGEEPSADVAATVEGEAPAPKPKRGRPRRKAPRSTTSVHRGVRTVEIAAGEKPIEGDSK